MRLRRKERDLLLYRFNAHKFVVTCLRVLVFFCFYSVLGLCPITADTAVMWAECAISSENFFRLIVGSADTRRLTAKRRQLEEISPDKYKNINIDLAERAESIAQMVLCHNGLGSFSTSRRICSLFIPFLLGSINSQNNGKNRRSYNNRSKAIMREKRALSTMLFEQSLLTHCVCVCVCAYKDRLSDSTRKCHSLFHIPLEFSHIRAKFTHILHVLLCYTL